MRAYTVCPLMFRRQPLFNQILLKSDEISVWIENHLVQNVTHFEKNHDQGKLNQELEGPVGNMTSLVLS